MARSSNGWMPSRNGAAAASVPLALESATNSSSHTRASASALFGGWRWISTSCSYVPPAPYGTRYTVSGKIDHHESGMPRTERA